jgi:ribosomal protein S18 acetylase RimI-like enzyme
VIEPYDRFWAEYLGVKPTDWSVPGVSVDAHVGLAGYCGVWFFRRRDRLVVSAPDGWVPHITQYLANTSQDDDVTEEAPLRELFGDDFIRRIGPAFQGALALERFRPVHDANVRQPAAGDAPASAAFRAESGEEGSAVSGIEAATLYRAAYFMDGRVAALSGYRPWTDHAGDPCVLTHPEYRGRGCGTAVVSMTVERALAAGKLLLYQTLESNTAAVKLARRLGYERYAQHIALPLKANAPSNPPPVQTGQPGSEANPSFSRGPRPAS